MHISGFLVATTALAAGVLLIAGSAVALTVVPVDVTGQVQDVRPIGTPTPEPTGAAGIASDPSASPTPRDSAVPVTPPEAIPVTASPSATTGGNSGVGQGNGGGNGTGNEGNGKGPTK